MSVEVGYSYDGCSDRPEVVARQREVLQMVLGHFGDDALKWEREPYIIKMCNHDATLGFRDFGRKLFVNVDVCRWGFHGLLREAPPNGNDWMLREPGTAL